MQHRALYRKWRPADFDSVCGQKMITDILKYQVASNKTSHAYLFCGSRGTGKTSCAKIFAKAVNCLNPIDGNPCNQCEACRSIDAGTATDVIEMDAASNTGVDNVRDIKEEIVFSPALLKYRVYIIDEVHMMSGSAFNALLKTLEEPPAHVIFILATTELHKLPSTIVSRCQRYDFKRLSSPVIVERLMTIAENEKIDLDPDGAKLIARMSLGGMRDAISLLELCAGLRKKIDYRLVYETLGTGNRAEISALVRAIFRADYDAIYKSVADVFMNSRDISVFFGELVDFYRDMMITKTGKDSKEYLELTDVEYADLLEIAESVSLEKLLYHSSVLEQALYDMQKTAVSKRSVAELALTRMCEPSLSHSIDSLLSRISALEDEIARIKCGVSPISTPVKNVKIDTKNEAEEKTPDLKDEPETSKPAKAALLSSVSYWRDAIEKIQAVKPALAGCLSGSELKTDGNGKFVIYLSSGFFASMAKNSESLRIISSIISSYEGKEVSQENVAIVVNEDIGNSNFDFEKELNG